MRSFLFLAFSLLLVGVLSLKDLDEECRVIRANSYNNNNGQPNLKDDEAERSYWASQGYDVGDNINNWNNFKQFGEDLICINRNKNKPHCISYLDPDHKYVDDLGNLQFHVLRICAECDPGVTGIDSTYNGGRCDCGHDQYCSRQYREKMRLTVNGTTGGQNEWTVEHGKCKDIPAGKIGSKCAPELSGRINNINDYNTLDPKGKLWCGNIKGWEGACYGNTCHMCAAPEIYEFSSGAISVECRNRKGEPRWCNNNGDYQASEVAGFSTMRDTSMTVFLSVICVATVTSCIIGCIMCKKGGTPV